ncbi:MAG TPA: DUF4430 domain-containing protein [Solirubrobacterales bacterium]|nr:DUF4430 domain-containing protein [Solirubrobacterales bacterium]
MRKLIATVTVATLSIVVLPPVAQAAQTEVNVRIEGHSETLFEGPVLVEPAAVMASSDTESRRCDGINSLDPENVVPAPTPTSASADALGLLGETFDGQWYPGFDDYFITRWGVDEQSPGENAYWGILVNDTFTSVGGCQYQLDGGDEVLWVYDAFKGRPNLALFPEEAHYTSGPRPLTATVPLGSPFKVEAVAFEDDEEDRPPATPGIAGSSPFANAEVAPVVTGATGSERVNVKATSTVTTNGEGKASILFTKPGWHRIKATVTGASGEEAIRSNRIDVCITGGEADELEKALEGASTCAEIPAADQVRTAPPLIGEPSRPEEPGDEPGGDSGTGGGSGGAAAGGSDESSSGGSDGGARSSSPTPKTDATPRLSRPRLNRELLAKGKVRISWRVTSAGPGIEGWTISSSTVGRRGAHWVTRARGTAATAATISLPKGHAYRLRLAITDANGRTSTIALGKVQVPKAGRPHRR